MKFLSLSINLFFIIFAGVYFVFPIDLNIPAVDGLLDFFYHIGLVISLLVASVDVYLKRKQLFKNIDYYRLFITFLATFTACIYIYNRKTPLGLSILLLGLCLIYGLVKKTYYSPHPIMVVLFLFSSLKIMSCLWSSDVRQGWAHIDYYTAFIFLPIISCFYRVEAKEQKAFIYPIFSFFTNLLTLTFIAYILTVKQLNQSFWSFLTLNKEYLGYNIETGIYNYYQSIGWSKTFHPSKIAWILLTVLAASYWLWQEGKKKIITTSQLSFYALLLLIVSLVLQARVAILGFFILVSLFIWVGLMRYVKSRKSIFFYTLLATFVAISGVILSITQTTFFSDPSRLKMSTLVFKSFFEYPFLGGGAFHEALLLHQANIDLVSLHNEFLTALSDQGILGLLLFLAFHILVVYYGLKNKYFLGIYVLLAFTIFNATEGVMGLPICIPFFLFCLIPPKQT